MIQFQRNNGETITIDTNDKRPILLALGSTTGHLGIHIVLQAIRKNVFQAIIPGGRGNIGSKSALYRMQKSYLRILGKQGNSDFCFHKFRVSNNIYEPIEIDFSQKNLGIAEEDLLLISDISKYVQLIITNNVADVSFLDKTSTKDSLYKLYQSNTFGVHRLQEIITQYFSQSTLLVHTGTFFANEGNNLYEDSKKKASDYLKKQNGNTLELSPPIICGQSKDGPNPYSTISVDGPFVVMKLLYNLLENRTHNNLKINVEKNTPMHAVTVDKLANLMLDLIIERFKCSKNSFENINCTAGRENTITPQETLCALIAVYNKLNNSSYPSDYIATGDETIGFDEQSTQIIEKPFAYARRNRRRNDCGKGFPSIGVNYNIFYRQMYSLAIRNFRPKGRILHNEPQQHKQHF